jgi:hypothetical protein
MAEKEHGTLRKSFTHPTCSYVLRAGNYDSASWAPLHKGCVVVCLQVQKKTSADSGAVHLTGENGEPAWEPSQNGWFFDLPQAHHQ